MVTFSMTFMDAKPSFKDHSTFEVQYLKNGAFYGQSYYSTLIGNHTYHIHHVS